MLHSERLGLELSLQFFDLLLDGSLLESFDSLLNFLLLCLVGVSHCLVVRSIRSTRGGNLLDFRDGLLDGEALVGVLELLSPLQFGHTPANPPVEVFSARIPGQRVADHTLCLHTSSSIVQISELVSNVEVDRLQLLFTGSNLSLDILVVRIGLELVAESLKGGVKAPHRLGLVTLTILHFANARRFQDTTPRLLVSVHFHVCGVDGRIDNHPRTTTEFTVRWDVNEDGLFVFAQGINDLGSKLEDLAVHVTCTSGETTPVGENDQRQVLSPIEILNGLSRLECRVREPNLTGLRLNSLPGLRVSRICWDAPVDKPGFDSDASDWNTAKLTSSHDNGLTPTCKGLFESSFIEESSLESLIGLDTGKHVPWVVRRFGRFEFHGSGRRILGGNHRHNILVRLGHVR
mmetsp:Transcript_17637/g.35580  ORF Transcript_17637/g.35580 Transcript_17637/m.35580 type:complete len:404 (+) Transcript_17637:428-1639(+)